MNLFTPCQGKHACRDDGDKCLTCGRSLEEIASLRDLLNKLSEIAINYEYQNVEEYSAYLKRKVEKIILHRRQEQAHG